MRVVGRIIDGFLRWARHDRGTQPGIGCEHAVKTDQMQAWSRHQRGQALHEFQRRHLDMRGVVTPGAFELQHDITCAIALEPFVGNRGTRDVAAQPFEFLALMRATAHPGMQAETLRISAQGHRISFVPAGYGSQAQPLLPRAAPARCDRCRRRSARA